MSAVLEDWRNAPVDPRLRAMLEFLERLTLDPHSLTAEHAAALRQAGVSTAAAEDAIHVCVLFNVYDRLADALEFDIPDDRGFAQGAQGLLKRGYA